MVHVTDDPELARRAAAAGDQVVVIVPPSLLPVLDLVTGGAGRVALLVGDPDDPVVRAAAEAMAAELFGLATAGAPTPTSADRP